MEKKHSKRSFLKMVLMLILAFSLSEAEAFAQTSKPHSFTVQCNDAAGMPQGPNFPVEIVWKRASARLVLVGAAGGPSGPDGSGPIAGVPPWCRFQLPRPLPGWIVSGEFCLDTAKLAAKEQIGLEIPSFLFVSLLPGYGRPTWSVKAGAPEHIASLCFSVDDPPFLILQNSWSQPQVMTFILAGEARTGFPVIVQEAR